MTVDTVAPTILPIPAIPKTDQAVDAVDVTFSQPIDPAHPLTTANLTLTKNGTSVAAPFPAGVTVTQDTTNLALFHITGLAAYTAPSTTPGVNDAYRLTVSSANVQDLAGNAATGSQSVNFTVASSPFVTSIGPAAPPSTAPVDSLDVKFSDPVQTGTFAISAVSLQTVDWATFVNQTAPPIPGTPVPLPSGASITQDSPTEFHINGLASATTTPGNYALTVDSSNIMNTSGTAFAGTLTYYFSVLPGNGVVGIAAVFKQSPTTTNPHHVMINSILQDPNNDGYVNTTSVTFNGQVWRPGEASMVPPDGSHYYIEIDAFANGAASPTAKIVWDTQTGGILPNPSDPTQNYIYQGTAPQGQPGGPNYAFFGLTVPLQAGDPNLQTVTFQVNVVRNAPPGQPGATPGQANWLYWQDALTTNDLHPLTATLTVDTVAPTIAPIPPVTSPRVDPVQSVNVTFSKPIDPSTFTVDDLMLTRDGMSVPLASPPVTITPTDSTNTTFTIGGLQNATTPTGTYVLTVNGAGIQDPVGNPVNNSQTLSFNVVTTLASGPQVVTVQRFGFHVQPTSIVIAFTQGLNPTSASNVNAYEVFSPGKDGQPGTADDVMVPIMSATYDAATQTVTLVPVHQLYLYDEYVLVVKGTGPNAIVDVNGVALDGKANGQPGSDYTTVFGQQNLAGPAPTSKAANMPGHAALRLSRKQRNQVNRWKTIIHSGGPSSKTSTTVPAKHTARVQPRRITIRKK